MQLLFFEERLWFCSVKFQWVAVVTAYITMPLGISCQRAKLPVYLYKDISKAVRTRTGPSTPRAVLTLPTLLVEADLPNGGLMLYANHPVCKMEKEDD